MVLNMENKSLKINIENVPDDLSQLPEDGEIVIKDLEPMLDDSFWEDVED